MSCSSKIIPLKINDINTPGTTIPSNTFIEGEKIKISIKNKTRPENANDINTDINSSEMKFTNKEVENNTTINVTNHNIKDHEYLNNNFVKSCNLGHKDEEVKSLCLINHHIGEKDDVKESHIELKFSPKKNLNGSIDLHNLNKTKAQKKWGKLRNVFKIISNIRNINARNLDNVSELEVTLQKKKGNKMEKQNSIARIIGRGHPSQTSFEQNIELLAKQTKLFEYCATGLETNLPKIVNILKEDPKRNFYDESQKSKFLVNQKNYDGVTFLYTACLNGHLKVVEILVKYGADHLLKCGEKNEEQSVLDVSIRWGHIKLVEYLIQLDWPMNYLKSGLKEATLRKNQDLINFMKKAITSHKLKHKKKSICCF